MCSLYTRYFENDEIWLFFLLFNDFGWLWFLLFGWFGCFWKFFLKLFDSLWLLFFKSDLLLFQHFLLLRKFKLFLLQLLFLVLKLSHNGCNLIFHWFFSLLGWFFGNLSLFLRGWAFLDFAFILKIHLRHESSWLNELDVIVSTWANVFVVHKPFKSDYPWPFFNAVSSTEINLLIFRS